MSDTNFSIWDTTISTRGKEMFTFPVLKIFSKCLNVEGGKSKQINVSKRTTESLLQKLLGRKKWGFTF